MISKREIWKYNASGVPLETSWKNANFDDGSWPSGQAILGFGEGYIQTKLPTGFITYYFRKSFALSDPPANLARLTLLANYDDGFVAYLNGQEVVRRAMPSGTISDNTLASSHEGGSYESIDLTAHLSKLVIGANVLAVEVHQNSATNSDLVMDLELNYQQAVCVVRGPYLQSGSSTQMVVRWRTDVPTNSRVRYSANPDNLWRIAEDLTVTTEHEVRLSGLASSTKYYYSVGSTNGSLASGLDYYFITAPAAGRVKRTRVWVLGDAGTSDANQKAVRDAYYNFTGATHTDLWVMLGDNAYDSGTDREYQAAVFDIYPTMLRKSVLWPAFGNHDGQSASSPTQTGVFYNIFTLPSQGEAGGLASGTEAYYSFNFSNIHFICLNSEDIPRATTGAMLTWLQQDLTANKKHWTVAFWHHPPYSKGSHDSDTESRMIEMRQRALPLLENGGVDMVLTGHSHSYERSFLLDRHYDASTTLTSDMILDAGNGRPNGDGPYTKLKSGPAPHKGTVYVVAGSSGKTSGGTLDHPAMYLSLNVLGSMVLDFNSDRVDAKFLDRAGNPQDYFTIRKGVAAPSSLTATAVTTSQIDLAWVDNSYNENGFKIERKISQSGTTGAYTMIATVGANVRSYSNTGLTAATTYYYRIQAYNSGGNSLYSNEANATTPIHPNLAFNKPATASSTNDSYLPGKAVDENTDTYWRSGSVGENTAVWWRVDLGAAKTISRVVVNWQSSYYAKEYEIQVSNDDVNYAAVYTNNSGNGGVDEAKFSPTSGRYVRIYMTAKNESSARIKEIEVYAGAAASAKATAENVNAAFIPDAVTLAQNYPNPFNPTTTISYSLPAGMNVTLKVVNTVGQEVTTLANGYHERGVYRVTFEAQHLPSGVYFAILRAAESTKVIRMLFMK
jgi:hypothetical protein